MKALQYLFERLKEPGSIRSLALLVFLLKGQVPDEEVLQQSINGILILVTFASFIVPETSTKIAEAIQNAEIPPPVEDLHVTQLLDETKQVLGDVQSKILSLSEAVAAARAKTS